MPPNARAVVPLTVNVIRIGVLAHAELASGRLVKPLGDDGLEVQGHRLACQIGDKDLPKIATFRTWLKAVVFDTYV